MGLTERKIMTLGAWLPSAGVSGVFVWFYQAYPDESLWIAIGIVNLIIVYFRSYHASRQIWE
jgi:hypothetical protein